MHLTSKILVVVGLLAVASFARPERKDQSSSNGEWPDDKNPQTKHVLIRCLTGGAFERTPCPDDYFCLRDDWRCHITPFCPNRKGWCVPTMFPTEWDTMSAEEAERRNKKFVKKMTEMKKERDASLSEEELENVREEEKKARHQITIYRCLPESYGRAVCPKDHACVKDDWRCLFTPHCINYSKGWCFPTARPAYWDGGDA